MVMSVSRDGTVTGRFNERFEVTAGTTCSGRPARKFIDRMPPLPMSLLDAGWLIAKANSDFLRRVAGHLEFLVPAWCIASRGTG